LEILETPAKVKVTVTIPSDILAVRAGSGQLLGIGPLGFIVVLII